MGYILFRLGFWLLLTSEWSLANLAIGLVAALLIPRIPCKRVPIKISLAILWKCIVSIPLAYIQALEIMVRPHRVEHTESHPVYYGFNPLLVFMEIFLVTFTPKSLVVELDDHGRITVHHLRVRKKR